MARGMLQRAGFSLWQICLELGKLPPLPAAPWGACPERCSDNSPDSCSMPLPSSQAAPSDPVRIPGTMRPVLPTPVPTSLLKSYVSCKKHRINSGFIFSG